MTQWNGPPRWLLVPLLLAGAVSLALLVVGYRYGIPLVAQVAADQVPDPWVDALGQAMLTSLDGNVLQPTQLPRERRDHLLDRFSRLTHPGARRTAGYQVLFRKSDHIGPNAMALPSGIIVVTDALVTLADRGAGEADEAVTAVLAHEAGHVQRRHGIRLVLQNSLIGMVLAWLVGDPGSVMATAPAVLLEAKYSRDLEREADAYAVAVLDANGIQRRHFARMLMLLEQDASDRANDRRGTTMRYLSTHPVTAERLEALR